MPSSGWTPGAPDCFFGTDLETLLPTLGIEIVVLPGINTKTCVMNTAFSAFNRNFQVIVISDCVASMYGDDLHVLSLENVKHCLNHVLTAAELKNPAARLVDELKSSRCGECARCFGSWRR